MLFIFNLSQYFTKLSETTFEHIELPVPLSKRAQKKRLTSKREASKNKETVPDANRTKKNAERSSTDDLKSTDSFHQVGWELKTLELRVTQYVLREGRKGIYGVFFRFLDPNSNGVFHLTQANFVANSAKFCF